VFRWLRRLVYLVVLVAFVYLVVTSAQVVLASRTSLTPGEVKPASAIVVIGSATGPGGPGALSEDLKLRCEEAISLYRAGRSHTIITTGANAYPGAPTEASAAASYLKSHGVARVTMVPLSQIPAQIAFVDTLLPRSSDGRVILVADPLQTRWLEDVAAADHLQAQITVVPAPKQSVWHEFQSIWGQSVAVALGRVIGFKNTGSIGG
jgi:vancomycin permeability regulator SanA